MEPAQEPGHRMARAAAGRRRGRRRLLLLAAASAATRSTRAAAGRARSAGAARPGSLSSRTSVVPASNCPFHGITKNGRPAAVLVNPEELARRKEIVAVRADASLTREIRAGLRVLRKSGAKLYTLDELLR